MPYARMETVHNRSKWKMKCVACIVFLLTLFSQTDSIAEHKNGEADGTVCAENEYFNEEYGICCDRCSPGYKLTKRCTGKGLRSTCERCSDESYQDKTNSYEQCFPCITCKKHEFEKSPCTHKQNRVCECEHGYYRNEIDSITYSCRACKKCGDGERESRVCIDKNNTECKCKDLHYRVDKKTCALCKGCSPECPDLCTSHSTTVTPHLSYHPISDPVLPVVLIPLLATTTVLSVVIFIAYEGFKRWRKKNRNLLQQSESPDPEKDTTEQSQSHMLTNNKDEESTPLAIHRVESEQDQALPDCVPREIRIHEFIYFVLEVVPVTRFKELARRLDVSEQDIDRAERDNRAFVDAQYQILKVWSDNAAGGGKNILPRPLLQEFVDRLKDMNLHGCADSIETKYCTET